MYTISYNYLNLPYLFRDKNGNALVQIFYDATGKKLAEKRFTPTGPAALRVYLGDMEFQNGNLAIVHTAKGRMLPNDISNATAQAQPCDPTDVPDVPADPGDGTVGPGGGGGDIGVLGNYSTFLPEDQTVYEGSVTSSTALIPTTNAIALTGQEMVQLEAGFSAPAGTNLLVQTQNCTQSAEWQYEYYLKDHLGNIRVRFADLDLNGSISPSEVLGEHHYYPFGMEMEGAWNSSGQSGTDDNRYRYNGKEFNEELGLYDYGARWYDPAIGRWGQIDPHAENYLSQSPYHYAGNNPIIFADYDGRDYGLTFNSVTNTVTVSATYYAATGDLDAAKDAVALWNSESGNYTMTVGEGEDAIEYTVEFDLTVSEVEVGAGESKLGNLNAALTADDSGEGNVFNVVGDETLPENTNGKTTGGNYVQVKESQVGTGTGEHEVGHTLGLKHTGKGIMTAAASDSNRERHATKNNVKTMMKYPLRNKVNSPAGKGTVRSVGGYSDTNRPYYHYALPYIPAVKPPKKAKVKKR